MQKRLEGDNVGPDCSRRTKAPVSTCRDVSVDKCTLGMSLRLGMTDWRAGLWRQWLGQSKVQRERAAWDIGNRGHESPSLKAGVTCRSRDDSGTEGHLSIGDSSQML